MTMLNRYFTGIRKELGYFPSWPPNAPYQLGDIGQVVNGGFSYVTSLENLGIPFTPRIGRKGESWEHSSHDSVSWTFKAAGQTLPGVGLPEAEAGVQIEFSSAGACVFHATDVTVHLIADQNALSKEIVKLFTRQPDGERVWQKDWFVVTEVVTAGATTVLIADSDKAGLDISFGGAVPTDPAPLAKLGGGVHVVDERGKVTKFLAKDGLTPLIKLKRVRQTLLGELLGKDNWAKLVQQAGPEGVPGLPDDVTEEVEIDDWIPIQGHRHWIPKPAAQPGPASPLPASPPPPRRAVDPA